MTLTGKCEEDFEKWFNRIQRYNIDWFNRLALEYQYGVYVDFFELNNCEIINTFYYLLKRGCSVPLARQQAIEKANEIYNLKQ